MSEELDVEISLVNTNNRDLLECCLASLPAACNGLRWHVTVVDNASEDGSAEMVAVHFPWAGLIRNEFRLGFGANHNQVLRPVIEQASARFVLLLNEDTEARPGSIAALVRYCHANSAVGAAAPALVDANGLPQSVYQRFPSLRDHLPWRLTSSRGGEPGPEQGHLNGACLLLRSEALRQVGALDERFFIFYEDTDIGRRLWDVGWSSAVCTEATVVHHEHQTVSKSGVNLAMEQQMLRSRFLYLEKHTGRRQARLAAVATRTSLALRALKASAERVARRDPGALRHARLLLRLACYDPRRPLAHEVRAQRQRR